MNTNWLAALSFTMVRELITAINIVSINAKLCLANKSDVTDQNDLDKARRTLSKFLSEFEGVLENTEHDQDGLVVGSDPRFSQLVNDFLAERRRLPNKSALFVMPISELSKLVNSNDVTDLAKLIDLLRELRNILEHHSRSDFLGVIGDI